MILWEEGEWSNNKTITNVEKENVTARATQWHSLWGDCVVAPMTWVQS